ncbi:MAG: ErfK/YbiS/YcfS/YnhG family protein [Nocardioidaceae bacterium]|nr:ErfK/YbiS/YcfS/YnhG family protein [Nocardioidaceae bacterium]
MSTRRARPRYDRMTALLVSTGVTIFALLAGTGAIGGVSAVGEQRNDVDLERYVAAAATPQAVGTTAQRQEQAAATPAPAATPSAAPTETAAIPGTGTAADTASPSAGATGKAADGSDVDVAVPADSGSGRRIVFDMSDQRVWLVGSDGTVQRTYLVSGSVTDNLDPGHYNVYSRSRYAVGVDDSGTMQYFVRFTRGNNAAIGFHDIPYDNGKPLQTERQLGTPQSHGCIRQLRADAIRLWDFAPDGTAVDVVA